jgi:hypothetical protein
MTSLDNPRQIGDLFQDPSHAHLLENILGYLPWQQVVSSQSVSERWKCR